VAALAIGRSGANKRDESTVNALGGGGGILVLPNSNDLPACRMKPRVVFAISLSVPPKLRLPVVRIRLGNRSMLWAAVPKAAINEHRNVPGGKDDVGSDLQTIRVDWKINPEAKPSAMELRSQFALRSGSRATV
jgi:hypothetical protein